jgi:hypothetical protein
MGVIQLFLRKWFCKHDFHLLTSYKKDVDETLGYNLQEVFVIYCPKCREEKCVNKHEYEIEMKRQEVDRSHAKEYR